MHMPPRSETPSPPPNGSAHKMHVRSAAIDLSYEINNYNKKGPPKERVKIYGLLIRSKNPNDCNFFYGDFETLALAEYARNFFLNGKNPLNFEHQIFNKNEYIGYPATESSI